METDPTLFRSNRRSAGPRVGFGKLPGGRNWDRRKDHDVPGGDDEVELAAEIDRGEIRAVPREGWCLCSRALDEAGIEIDSDRLDSPPRQLDSDPARTAPGIEHRSGIKGGDEVRFTVGILTSSRESFPACVVVVAR